MLRIDYLMLVFTVTRKRLVSFTVGSTKKKSVLDKSFGPSHLKKHLARNFASIKFCIIVVTVSLNIRFFTVSVIIW